MVLQVKDCTQELMQHTAIHAQSTLPDWMQKCHQLLNVYIGDVQPNNAQFQKIFTPIP